MHCPRCGKENPEDANFCMHCGADLREYKVEISPKIEVSPKVSAYAKAEAVPYPKWKPKVERYVEIKGKGKLPVYKRFAEHEGKPFCPQCGNYDSLEYISKVGEIIKLSDNRRMIVKHNLYRCLASACNKFCLREEEAKSFEIKEYVKIKGEKGEKIPVCSCVDFDINIKPFCPHCGTYDSLKEEPILKTKHIEGRSVTIVEYNVYRCLACGKQTLIFRDSKQYQLPSVTKYRYLYGVGKVPVTRDTPEICPNCKEPAIKFKKYTYFLASRKEDKEEDILGGKVVVRYYYSYYGYKHPYYECSSCGFGILVDSSEEEYLGRTPYTSHTKYSDIGLNKDDIVVKLCQFCGERAAVIKEGSIIEYSYKCERCGKILCENCVRIEKGLIFRYYYCPSCASSRMCQICGEYVANYICSSCSRRICKDCADGILSKKCPYCGSKLRKL